MLWQFNKEAVIAGQVEVRWGNETKGIGKKGGAREVGGEAQRKQDVQDERDNAI